LTTDPTLLRTTAAGIDFQNPVVLAAGTAGFGRELSGVLNLDALGGIVTKAVSPMPRAGAPSPRVADFDGGMINAVGLANPGLQHVRDVDLPWLAANLGKARVIVNVVGERVEDFSDVIAALSDIARVDAFELNVSCPNVKEGGLEFGASDNTLRELVQRARAFTRKPIFVKLSPTLSDISRSACVAVDAGADGLTLVNTLPGLVIDTETRRPVLGFGSGGVSGPGLLPVGVLAVANVHRATPAPILGLGGVSRGTDAVQYLLAGASLVGVGTATMRDPRAPERILSELFDWCTTHGIRSVAQIVGAMEWRQ
jgi:dihydroorotate dehydrogenase (NAD+) catalytic subunit